MGMVTVRLHQKICEFSESHCIANVIHLPLSVIFGLCTGKWRITAQGDKCLRLSRQPRRSLTAISSLVSPGKVCFPTPRCLAKSHADLQAADKTGGGLVKAEQTVGMRFAETFPGYTSESALPKYTVIFQQLV